MAPPPKFDHEEARRLRASGLGVQEIADLFGVTKGAISQATRGIEPGSKPDAQGITRPGEQIPETFTEMLELAAPELWRYFKTVKGVAKVQAYSAIREGAKREREEGTVVPEPEPLIADVVSGAAALSLERRHEILTAERSRLVEEIDAIDAVMSEAVAA